MIIEFISGTEKSHELPGEKLETYKGGNSQYGCSSGSTQIGLFYTGIVFGSVIEPHNRLGSLGNPNDNGQKHHVYFGHDPYHSQRYVASVNGM